MVLAATIVLVIGAIAMLIIIEVGSAANQRAQAQTAADAAALAGAASTDAAVHELAAINGAIVESIERRGQVIEVRVRIGKLTATAAAERSLEICGPGRPCERLFSP